MDAMDEWRDHRMFIEALAVLNSESSVVKFVLTDRLNPCASRLPGSDRVSIYAYALGPISKEVIKVYFQKYLETVSWVDGRKASSADVEKLTELSGGLPVWASTVVVLLSHPFNESPPHEILAEIVRSRRQVGGSDGLGELYLNALRRLFPSPDAQKYFRQLIGATIILQEPLSLVEFSKLTGIPSHLINKIQFPLSALQTRSPPPGSEKMIHPATTLFHLSFLEYVQAPTTDASFAVSVFDSHTAIGLTCLNQLATLSRSSPDSNYPLRALQRYAVKYWLHHVFKGTPRLNDQWLQTKHCSTLQMISDSHGRWAALFLKSLMLGEVDSILEEVRKEAGMVSTLRKLADRLREAGGDYWGFQVACLEVAVRIDGGDAEGWSELGICYSESGRRTGNLWMHEEAVVAFRRTSHLRPDPHPECGLSLKYVATALWSCYQQNGESIILSEAISFSRMALTLCPTLHPDRHLYLSNLANVLGDSYGHNGSLEILNEVISLYRDALALCPASDSNYPSCINNLAASLHFLYRHNGDIAVLNEAISLHWEALALCPVRHPDYPFSINIVINLATSLQHLYHHNEDVDALNDAISLYHEALPLYPVPHPDRPRLLNSLANSLISLYHHNSDIDTLNEAISLHREALPLRPALHPDCPSALNDLANSLQSLYECNRDIDALTEAISLHREALGLRPASHLGHSLSLRNLASSLHALHQHNNDLEALNECISLSHEGLALCPAPHPHRDSILRFLVQVYLSEFEQNGAIEALDEAISLYREVLVLCPPGRGYRAEVVQCLVQLLELRREVTGDDRDCAEVEDLRAKLEALEAGSSGIQPEERLSMAALVEETFDSESE
ncbi:hypothetical protein EST38_g12846 [Candolleomyces aberdarensis]|uniref:TPR-like protein n=1 Tax=Candolleomyces aberdarensis TaxID=2316362 RepID=A0A4Q2D1E9_9AGAR|nr:hypothetical protein EST38_g12846 [Candolleomyces aberdarensis]